MRKSLASLVLGLGLVGAASAQSYGYSDHGYQHNDYREVQHRQADPCIKQRKDGQTGGAIVGGLLGALAGGAIGNNIDGRGDRFRRGFRGQRGGGFRNFRRGRSNNSGRVAAGAVIGGLVGAVAGSQVGKSSVKCNTYHSSVNTSGYRGDPSIAAPTRQPWTSTQTQSYPVSQPTTTTRTVRTIPAPTQPTQVYRNDDLRGGRQSCETLTRVTRLPDGREIREQVQDCQQGEVYYERDGRRVQGGF